MKTLFARYRAEMAKQAAYRRTRDEIANLPRSTAIDLGIFPEDAAQIARVAEAPLGCNVNPTSAIRGGNLEFYRQSRM